MLSADVPSIAAYVGDGLDRRVEKMILSAGARLGPNTLCKPPQFLPDNLERELNLP